MFVMRHPITGKWIMMGNWQFVISDNPTDFKDNEVRYYDNDNEAVDMGFACEIINYNNKWYRSGTIGEIDHWKLGFSEIEWQADGAFKVIKPGVLSINSNL
jgi:hypothetical protein